MIIILTILMYVIVVTLGFIGSLLQSFVCLLIVGVLTLMSCLAISRIIDMLPEKVANAAQKEKLHKNTPFIFVALIFSVVIFGGGAMLLSASAKADVRSVFGDLEDTQMILVDPTALGLEGEEGRCNTMHYGYYSEGKFKFSFHTWDDDGQEYFYEYTIHPRMRKGKIFYLNLKLLEESTGDMATDLAPESVASPKKITWLQLVVPEFSSNHDDDDDGYTTFILADSNRNVLAHSPNVNVEINQSNE